MWKMLRVLGLLLAFVTVAIGLLGITEVIAVSPMTVLELAVLTLAVLAVYLISRRGKAGTHHS